MTGYTRTTDKGEASPVDRKCVPGGRVNSCRFIPEKIQDAKNVILAESRHRLKTDEHLLRLALNEAEALAWQTRYPHLVFADLAHEKVREVERWIDRQRSIRRNDMTVVLTA